MKLFHKKFLNQETVRGDNTEVPADGKSKVNYMLHQLLIWGIIFSVMYFVVKFYTIYA